ncbi:pentatricopeptide repeat-containing protein [Tanacetum coccineum]
MDCPTQCRHAKRWALSEGETTIKDHYAYIRSYGKAILESNHGSIVKVGVTVNLDSKTYFDRFYICFKGLKEGWKLGCRNVIALDGCFRNKPNVGEILTAIGQDRNNNIFPVAWVVVNVKNKDNWSWFLDLLGDDLDMPTGNGLTLISDQHKARTDTSSYGSSKASYPRLFNKIMDKIKRANPKAYQYLLDKDPNTWLRAYFRIGINYEAVENGFSECFNSVLLRVRNKPLITMLESMRVIVLERMNTMRKLLEYMSKHTEEVGSNQRSS